MAVTNQSVLTSKLTACLQLFASDLPFICRHLRNIPVMLDIVTVLDGQPLENGAERMSNRRHEFPQVFVVEGISQKIHLAPQIPPFQSAKLAKKISASSSHAL
jgi:hypothetical protein